MHRLCTGRAPPVHRRPVNGLPAENATPRGRRPARPAGRRALPTGGPARHRGLARRWRSCRPRLPGGAGNRPAGASSMPSARGWPLGGWSSPRAAVW